MSVRIAINGFGRIGRLLLRTLFETQRKSLNLVAINDLAPLETNVHLLVYDSIHHRFPYPVTVEGTHMKVDGHPINVFQETNPQKLPWNDLMIDIVLECSGRFTSRQAAEQHLLAGAKKVLISAPATDEDITIVYGVNHDKLQKNHTIVSNASCTTNCLAPVVFVLHQGIGIQQGFMTTIHSYTGDQNIVDTVHKDLNRTRAAALNLIPTSTGAAKAIGKVLPELQGKLEGTSIRVPTPNVSVIDFTFTTSRQTSVEEITDLIKTAAHGNRFKGILGYYNIPLVSSDFNHDPHSSIFALHETKVIDNTFVRILSWYDNEWGFVQRMCDTAQLMANL